VSKVEIINPLPGGMRYTSVERARKLCSIGIATMSVDGRLLFAFSNQAPLLDTMRKEDEIARNQRQERALSALRPDPGGSLYRTRPRSCSIW
jgi:hypothetical protein